MIVDGLTVLLLVFGAGFFLFGTVGILRLPDLLSRLHALTKADNLGLGFIVVGLALQAPSLIVAAKMIAVWLIALASAATVAQLIAIHGRSGVSGGASGGEEAE